MRWRLLLLVLLMVPALSAGHPGHEPGQAPRAAAGSAGGGGSQSSGNATQPPASEPAMKPGPWPPPPANATARPGAPNASAPTVPVPQVEESSSAQTWLGFKGDPSRTGATLARVPRNPGRQWDAAGTVGTGVLVNPVVARGLVVFGGLDRKVHAVEASTGFPAWSADVPAMVFASPVVVGDAVVVLTADGMLQALALSNGAPRWAHSLGSRASGPPLAVNGAVYAVTESGVVAAVDAATGLERWNLTLPGIYDQVGPTWLAGRVIVGDRTGKVHALAPLTGRTLWTADVGAAVTATPVGIGTRVVVPTLGLKALEQDTGRVAWTLPAKEFVVSSPAFLGNMLVYGDPEGQGFVGVNVQTVQRSWRVETRLPVRSAPAIAGDVAVAAAEDGSVFAVALRNGTRLWEVDAGARMQASPVLLEGSVLLARMDGIVRLLADPDTPAIQGLDAEGASVRPNDGLLGLLPMLAALAAPYVALRWTVKRMRSRHAPARLRSAPSRPEPPARVRADATGPVRVRCPACTCRFGVPPEHHAVVVCPACGLRSEVRRRPAGSGASPPSLASRNP